MSILLFVDDYLTLMRDRIMNGTRSENELIRTNRQWRGMELYGSRLTMACLRTCLLKLRNAKVVIRA